MLVIEEVNEKNESIARELLTEYGTFLFRELKLMAGNNVFFNELQSFPDKKYKKPDGAFFIAFEDKEPIGCAGLKRFGSDSCELKRMYIRPVHRGKGYGLMFTKLIVNVAREMGFSKVLLDTNLRMPAAIKTYVKAGFREVPPYCENDNPNPVFMQYLFE